ncbi:hypothetical protein TWF696_005006 [Orbilia brochopaga]|uniref:LysM domain-containing protein n=1 Tax=Orbilia brochopaga TaxID=3140254 RepID=A0AAV9V2H8_9PEZI
MYTLATTPPPSSTACATCSRLLTAIKPVEDEKSEKLHGGEYRYYTSSCCARNVCTSCAEKNPRLITYCPFCPIKRPSPSSSSSITENTAPPRYTPSASSPPPYTATDTDTDTVTHGDVRHYLSEPDSIASLSLLYGVPPATLRSYNQLYSDHLLPARSYLLIPRSHYIGPSLSPSPLQRPESAVIARFQVATKCVDYDVAKGYLASADWDIDIAVERYLADEAWERAHPSSSSGSSSRMRTAVGGSNRTGVGSAGLRRGFFR